MRLVITPKRSAEPEPGVEVSVTYTIVWLGQSLSCRVSNSQRSYTQQNYTLFADAQASHPEDQSVQHMPVLQTKSDGIWHVVGSKTHWRREQRERRKQQLMRCSACLRGRKND